MNTFTDESTDLAILDDMEFAPTCDFSQHGKWGPEDLPAEWIVLQRATKCGCFPPTFYLWCTPCLERRYRIMTPNSYLRCTKCRKLSGPARGSLLSVERISGKVST